MAFSGPAHANVHCPHTGLLSLVLQRKHLQGHTGHMIIFIMRDNYQCYNLNE